MTNKSGAGDAIAGVGRKIWDDTGALEKYGKGWASLFPPAHAIARRNVNVLYKVCVYAQQEFAYGGRKRSGTPRVKRRGFFLSTSSFNGG